MKRKTVAILFAVLGSVVLLPASVLADGDLVTHWKFDEATPGAVITDSSGSGFDGTPHGVNGGADDPALLPQPSTDVPPTTFTDTHSLLFQGDGGNATGSYVDVSNWNVDTSNGFTVSLWAKPTTTPGSSWERFMDFGNGPASDNIVFAQNGNSSQVYFEVYNGGSTTKIIGPSGSWHVGSWHYYAATIDANGNATIYVDGTPIVSGTTNKPLHITRSHKYIGKSNWSDDYYEGYMDDMRVYSRALTQQEVTDLTNGQPGPGVPDDNGLAPGVEAAAPNGGDANADGTADSLQANVGSFVNTQTGNYVSVAAPADCTLSSLSTAASGAQASADSGYTYPAGLANYTASCGTPGYTATVTLYYYGLSAQGLVLRKYNPSTQTYNTVPNAVITQTTIGGQLVTRVTYQVTDGSALDTDGSANGVIVDPVGLALVQQQLTDTGVNLAATSFLAGGLICASLLVAGPARRRSR